MIEGRYKASLLFLLTSLVRTMVLPLKCGGFVTTATSSSARMEKNKSYRLSMGSNTHHEENDGVPESSESNENIVIAELSWRFAKIRLEEANKKSFLTRKPIKLSYADSQKWIQRNFGVKTKEEFNDLVVNGNLRTPYISKRPEEYYGERGEWISWEDYLLGNCTDSREGGKQKQSKWQ